MTPVVAALDAHISAMYPSVTAADRETLVRMTLDDLGAAVLRGGPFTHTVGVLGTKGTSKEAAWKVAPRTGTQRRTLLELIVKHDGLTDFELHNLTGMLDSSLRPRRGELVKGRLVRDSGRTRFNEYDNEAIIWVPTLTAKWALDSPGEPIPGLDDEVTEPTQGELEL